MIEAIRYNLTLFFIDLAKRTTPWGGTYDYLVEAEKYEHRIRESYFD